jgi:hypothetical protein
MIPRVSLGSRCRLVFIALYVLLLPPSALSQSSSSPPLQHVHGEVLMLTSELAVVKLTDGTSVLYQLGKDATVDSSLKVADRVEVGFTSDHHVVLVKKLTGDTEPLR